ncbi:alpha/beta-hydrolase family protein [Arthrobacter sp. 35W]|uniref:alpha/beta-hydrolase family protein n=1 Tax=Arthrobacter sp. 35W TaxID=1132441 RepID=UPI0004087BEF|nr:alpha/beta-hydrolase family protein [Arthrobacter sp. 35W]
MGALATRWQNEVRALVDMPPIDGAKGGVFLATAAAMAAVVLVAAWGLRIVGRRAGMLARRRGLGRVESRAVGAAAGFTALLVGLALVVGAGVVGVDRVYAPLNAETPEGATEPVSTHRSAGVGSAVEWEALGMQGRAFVGGGPSSAQISAVTGSPAMEPVHVYVGLGQGATLAERAELAVGELERTGGFSRGTLVVATPTGSGWLEPQAMDAVEYLHCGDTAIASLQYSYQPSWVSFVFDQELPREAGRALYAAVRSHWLALPADSRPTLLAYGLSLGALGMQSAFPTAADLLSGTEGAVFAGPPNASQPWHSLVAERPPGTPVWLPVLNGGRHIRWISNPGGLAEPKAPWEATRVAYLQHATDPVTWLSTDLILQRPEWLSGPSSTGGRSPGVSDAMVWLPLVTYLQVAVDMVMGEAVPAGHGHNYGNVAVDAFNGVSPSTLDEAALARVRAVVDGHAGEASTSN